MDYKAIEAAMLAEIDNPQPFYMPNSPGAFVRERLHRQSMPEEARWFWSNYCCGGFGITQLDVAYNKLQELVKNERMPEWGTRGT